MELILGYSLLGNIIFGIISHIIAKQKGYTGGFWWGFFLSVIGLIVVACRTDKKLLEGLNRPLIVENGSKPLNTWTCPECSTDVSESEAQCPVCGCKEWICPSCNRSNKATSSFCAGCGKAVTISIRCPKCGAKNNAQNDRCTSCGSFLKGWICMWCNTSNDYDAQFCRKCGKLKMSATQLSSEYRENGTCDLCGASHCYVKDILIRDAQGNQTIKTVCQICADNAGKSII